MIKCVVAAIASSPYKALMSLKLPLQVANIKISYFIKLT